MSHFHQAVAIGELDRIRSKETRLGTSGEADFPAVVGWADGDQMHILRPSKA